MPVPNPRLCTLLASALVASAIALLPAPAATAAAVATLSVRNPAPVVGETSVLSGKLPTRFARVVKVQYRAGSAWRDAVNLRTTAAGVFTWSTKAAGTRTYRAYAPTAKYKRKKYQVAVSPGRAVVAVAQSGSLTNASPAGASSAALTATFRPARSGRQVLLQARVGTAWTQVAKAAQSSAGQATFRYTPPRSATPVSTAVRAVSASSAGAPAYATAALGVRGPVDVPPVPPTEPRDVVVSLNQYGTPSGGLSSSADSPSISDDGNLVAFAAGFPEAPDANKGRKIYLRNIAAKTTQLISYAPNTIRGDWPSSDPVISGNGRYVVYATTDPNITEQKASARPMLVRYDTQTEATDVVSISPLAGNTVLGGVAPTVSTDGSRIAFMGQTQLSEIVFGTRLYVRDMNTDQTWIARSPAGVPDAGSIHSPVISGDGRYVAFVGRHLRLPDNDNLQPDIYRYDALTDTTVTVSVDAAGVNVGNDDSIDPDISEDGQRISFASDASNLVAGTATKGFRVYVRNMEAGVTSLRPGDQGVEGTMPDESNALSSDGSTLAALWMIPDTGENGQSARELRIYDLSSGSHRSVMSNATWSRRYVQGFQLTSDGRYGVYVDENQIHRFAVSGFPAN
ncbi:MAG: TolB-like protein [Marmoricola sp.]|nr:TolB-like protein [Marmoricola sp.]